MAQKSNFAKISDLDPEVPLHKQKTLPNESTSFCIDDPYFVLLVSSVLWCVLTFRSSFLDTSVGQGKQESHNFQLELYLQFSGTKLSLFEYIRATYL